MKTWCDLFASMIFIIRVNVKESFWKVNQNVF